jgi:hypothetical protein
VGQRVSQIPLKGLERLHVLFSVLLCPVSGVAMSGASPCERTRSRVE